jgi:hypothetical protein
LHINEDKAKWAACDLVKGPLCLKELVPHVPAQRMPDAVTVQEGDGRVAVVAVVQWWETETHLSPCSGLIWRPVHAFDGWARCRIKRALEPSLW